MRVLRFPKKYHNMVIKALNHEIKDLKDEFNHAEYLIQVKDDVNHRIDVDKNINRVEAKSLFNSKIDQAIKRINLKKRLHEIFGNF